MTATQVPSTSGAGDADEPGASSAAAVVSPAPEGRDLCDVRLEAFSGPIELLLELLRARKLEITEVSVARIVDDFLAAVNGAPKGSLDLEQLSKFLLVAATLIAIKTHRLLPVDRELDLDDDLLVDAERDVLLARLLAARTFKDVAAVLEDVLDHGSRYVPRSVQPEETVRRVAPDLLRQVTPVDLARIAARALTKKPEPPAPLAHVEPIRITVRGTIVALSEKLPQLGETTYRTLCEGLTRLEAVVHFLALLELLKAGSIAAGQASSFDDIDIRWVRPIDVGAPLDLTEWSDEDDGLGVTSPAEAAAIAGMLDLVEAEFGGGDATEES